MLDKRPAGYFENGEGSPRDALLILRLMIRDLSDYFSDFRLRLNVLTEEHNSIRVSEHLRELTELGYKMDRLVRELLDSAAIETGNLVLKEESFAPGTFLSGQISKILRQLRGPRIQPEIPPPSIDRHRRPRSLCHSEQQLIGRGDFPFPQRGDRLSAAFTKGF